MRLLEILWESLLNLLYFLWEESRDEGQKNLLRMGFQYSSSIVSFTFFLFIAKFLSSFRNLCSLTKISVAMCLRRSALLIYLVVAKSEASRTLVRTAMPSS